MLSSGTGEYRSNKHLFNSACLSHYPVVVSSWTRLTTSKRGRQTLLRLLLPSIQATDGVCLVRLCKTVWESSIRLCDSWEEIVSDGCAAGSRDTASENSKSSAFAFYYCKRCPCKSLHWQFGNKRNCDDCGHSPMQHTCYWNNEILTPIQKYGMQGPGSDAFKKLKILLDRCMLRYGNFQHKRW